MRVLIACGGSAGHIFPGMALAEELKRDNYEVIVVVSSKAQDKEYVAASGRFLATIPIETIIAAPMPYSLSFRSIVFTAKLIWACIQSLIIFVKYRPQVVVGFGGYVSFAPLFIAKLFYIPTLIHEQNVIPGRANMMLSNMVNKIATSFPETDRYFSQRTRRSKIVQTGLPLRSDLRNRNENRVLRGDFLKEEKEKWTILIVGGSQGAQNVNSLTSEAIRMMTEEQQKKIKVIHLTGKNDCSRIEALYSALNLEHQVHAFYNDMASLYLMADVVICRAGANTIFETAVFGLPCILIPHRAGTAHQQKNAFFLQSRGAAMVCDEKTVSALGLREMIEGLLKDGKRRMTLSRNIGTISNFRAQERLKQEIIDLGAKDDKR